MDRRDHSLAAQIWGRNRRIPFRAIRVVAMMAVEALFQGLALLVATRALDVSRETSRVIQLGYAIARDSSAG